MGEWSEVKYAVSRAGAHVAYQEAGRGMPLLLLIDGFVPIEDMDDEPRLSSLLRRIAGFSRAIRFDRRGVGLSDSLPDTAPTLEDWLDDAEAVLDAAGCEQAVIVGDRGGGLIALGFAAVRPKRVRALVVVNGYARFMAGPDHPCGADPTFMTNVRERLFDPRHPEGPFDIIRHLAPSAADDVRFRSWWDRAGRHGASPATARALRAVIEQLDLRSQLPSIEAKTLVLHRSGATIPEVGQGRYIAEHVRGAQYVELEGADAVWYVGETEQLLDEIEQFVTGNVGNADRADDAVTVVFTDIVDSTSRAAAIGDREWTQLFDRYEAAAHREVRRFGGEYIKSTGDGSLAIFRRPGSAVDAAVELHRAATALDLGLRIGLHTGPIERRGRDIVGLAVHVAARVLGLAESNEILLTAATAERLTGSTFPIESRGVFNLKGLPGSWPIMALGPESLTS